MPQKRGYRGKKSSGLNNQEKKEVKSMIHEQKEDKMQSYSSGLVQHNSAIGAGDLIQVIPRITQGVAEGQRVGNEIIAKRLSVQGLCNLTYNGASTRSRIGARVMIFSVKGYADGLAAINNAGQWINGLLREGTNVRAFDGSVKSYFLPANRDLITLHAEKRLSLTFPFQNNTGLAPDATSFPVQTQFATKYWKANIKCKNRRLKYSSITAGGGVDLIPNNYGPIMAVGYCKLDGSAPDVLDTGMTMETLSQLHFEDA